MQFRAGVAYAVLFVVIAAGAYGVIATAEAPEATIDEADADLQLAEGEEFEVNGTTYNVSELGGGQGTAEHVNESAALEASWSDGDTVELEEGAEYTVVVPQAGEDGGADNDSGNGDGEQGNETDDSGNGDGEQGNETDDSGNGDGEQDNETDDSQAENATSFTLVEDYDEDEYETVENEDGLDSVIVEDDENDTADRIVPIGEFDEIDTQTYEVGDEIEFYDAETEETIEGEVAEITGDGITVEYVGTAVDEFDLADGDTVILEDQEFAVHYPSDDEAYLSTDVASFQSQQEDIESFNERLRGLWWVVVLSSLTVVAIGGMAFMPVRS